MSSKEKLFKELTAFSNKHLRHRDYFVCVYGSCALENYTNMSDLDMFIAVKNHDVKDFKKIRDFLIDLHVRYNLNLDDEVPYENKLMVSYDDIRHAIALRSFIKKGSKYYVPAIEKKKDFLISPKMRWRLILNSFTSPHKYVCGNKDIYLGFKKDAEKSIIRLAWGLSSINEPTETDLFKVLLSGVNGEEGEMYLGYKKEHKEVLQYLQELILRNYTFNLL